MKGPGLRLGIDVRRRWTCPECGLTIRCDGSVAQRQCHRCVGAPWMKPDDQADPFPRFMKPLTRPETDQPAPPPRNNHDADG